MKKVRITILAFPLCLALMAGAASASTNICLDKKAALVDTLQTQIARTTSGGIIHRTLQALLSSAQAVNCPSPGRLI